MGANSLIFAFEKIDVVLGIERDVASSRAFGFIDMRAVSGHVFNRKIDSVFGPLRDDFNLSSQQTEA
jgi:hypothetical protein